VEADSESLGRMVSGYIKDSNIPLDPQKAYQDALQGEISEIMFSFLYFFFFFALTNRTGLSMKAH
jgi:hypothetical protein